MSGELLSGRCLCGAVRFQAKLKHPGEPEMDACHCAFCRRWSAGPFLGVACVPDALRIEGEDNVGTYKSSEWAERRFCKTCGSTLFWRMQDHSLLAISSQAFDDPAQFKFTSEIFIDEKPANYDFANMTKKMTGEDVMNEFQNQA